MPRVQQKRGTDANLTSVNPTPLAGELLVVSDENSLKVGNGTDAYTSLAYVTATPRSHTQAWSTITDTPTTLSGYGITDAVSSSDARLTDARTPTAHKASHQTGGSDALTPADIGAAPAASPTFTGDVTIDDKIIHAGDNSAIRFPANDTVTIETNGTERVRVGNSGVTVPNNYANETGGVYGFYSAINSSATNSATLQFLAGGNAASQFNGQVLVTSGGASAPSIANRTFKDTGIDFFGTSILIATGGQERARIDSTGRLGIGRTSPASALDVNGVITVSAGSAAAPAICASGDANSGLLFPAADTVAISTAGTERVRVDSSGRLLVGATSGTFPLTVVANSSAQGIQIRGRSADGIADIWMTSNDGATRYGYISSRVNTFQFRPPSGAIIDFANHAGTASLVRIQDGGNVGIGATSPTAKLDIDADTVRLRTAKTPASSSDTGNTGDICWDASYLYICTAANTWRRIAHSTW